MAGPSEEKRTVECLFCEIFYVKLNEFSFVTIQFPYCGIYIVFDINSSSFAYKLYSFYIDFLDFALITY